MTATTTRITISATLAMAVSLIFASGCAPNYFNSASRSIQQNDYASAATDLELGAQNGDRRCAYLLGAMLMTGEGVDPDPAEGVRWMREAAEAELPVAQVYLGVLYANGDGVEQDLTAASEWYRKAAEYGNPLAQAALGAALFYGIGVPVDTEEGYVWTKLAADQGFEKAVSNLSEMSDALTQDQQKQAARTVARFHPKKNEGPDPNFNNNRGNHASTNVRRAGEARGYMGTARTTGGY